MTAGPWEFRCVPIKIVSPRLPRKSFWRSTSELQSRRITRIVPGGVLRSPWLTKGVSVLSGVILELSFELLVLVRRPAPAHGSRVRALVHDSPHLPGQLPFA